MLIIIGIMLTGVLIGYLLRGRKISGIQKIITGLIWLLLFLLGCDVGSNELIIKNLPVLGLEAAIISTVATLGSVLFAYFLWRSISKTAKDER